MEKGGGMRGRVEGGDPGEEKAVIEAGLWGPHPDLLCILAEVGAIHVNHPVFSGTNEMEGRGMTISFEFVFAAVTGNNNILLP